jgi:maltose O-acetyltransferase
MSGSARSRMAAGEWYDGLDPELEALRVIARRAVFAHNTLPPDERGDIGPALRALFREFGANARIEAPFHCAYGFNIGLGDRVFVNAGCTILDTAPVHIGARTMLGPGVHIYCAEHHKDAAKRAAGLEMARPVDIGEDVWIGGGAIILAGVRIGAKAIVGAGAVVTRDVAEGTTVVGNPARPVGRPHS